MGDVCGDAPFLLCVVPVATESQGPGQVPGLRSQSHEILTWLRGGHWRQGPLLDEKQSMGALSRRSQPGKAGLNSHHGLKGVSALVCHLL